MDTLINMFADGEVRKNIYKPNADKKSLPAVENCMWL